MTQGIKRDVVFYWIGGTARGEWRPVFAAEADQAAVIEDLRRQGYFALRGSSAIGAPEGAPRA